MNPYIARQAALLAQLPNDSVVLLLAAPVAYRSHDVAYPYRQDNDFYYLTGFEEPQAAAILYRHGTECVFSIFCRPKDPAREQWEGAWWGPAEAKARLEADTGYSIDMLGKQLALLLSEGKALYYPFKRTSMVQEVLPAGAADKIPHADISPCIAAMRVLKSDLEIAHLQTAVDISIDAHLDAMARVRPLQHEYMSEAVLLEAFCRQGCRYPAYPSIVAGGANACILHYHANNKILGPTDLLLIDAGAEHAGYAADITRTFPVQGRFLPHQRALYEVVLAAQIAGIAAIKPGLPYSGIQTAVVETLVNGLLDLDILEGQAADLISEKAYRSVYMHGSGHWLGLDVHDAGTYQTAEGTSRLLEPGMVLTVEPGIYITAALTAIDPIWHGLGIRIEDDVVVTSTGCRVLSEALPKNAEDLEAIIGTR